MLNNVITIMSNISNTVVEATIEIKVNSDWFDSEEKELQFKNSDNKAKETMLMEMILQCYFTANGVFTKTDDDLKITFNQ